MLLTWAASQGANAPGFSVALQSSLTPSQALGSPTPTFTRASAAAHTDFEGIVRQVPAGAARFQGARYVRNRIATAADYTAWTNETMAVVGGVLDPIGGTAAYTFTAQASPSRRYSAGTLSTIASDVELTSYWVRRRTGTGTIAVLNPGSSNLDITANVTSTWKRFATTPVSTGGTQHYVGIRLGTSGDEVDVAFVQPEVVTGQTNQNPSEYVPSLATANADSGAIGVSYPWIGYPANVANKVACLNGNTVVGNVVVEAQGPAISSSRAECAGGVTAGVVDASGPLGYLAEGARTNLALQSQTFQTTWTAQNTAAVVADQYVAPDGTTTMDKLQTTASTTFFRYVQGSVPVSAAVYTYSCYLRYVNHRWAYLMIFDSASASNIASFDMLNGATGAKSSGVTSTIVPTAQAGVYRLTMTYTAPAGTVAIYVGFNNSDTATSAIWTAAGTEILGAWGAQVEQASFASSYIPTTTVAVTRAADVLTYPAAGNVSGTQGSAYAEVALVANVSAPFIADSGNSIYLYSNGGDKDIRMFDGTNSVTKTLSASMVGNVTKLASSFGASGLAITGSGLSAGIGTFDGDMNIGSTIKIMSHNAAVAGDPFGTIRNVRLYPQPLSATKLVELTS